MLRQTLACACIAALGSLLTPSAANARPWKAPKGGHTAEEYRKNAGHWEMAALALTVVDTAETINCINRGRCEEGNPLIGRHPSVGHLLLIRGLGDLAQYGVFRYLNDRDPIKARSFAIGGAIAGVAGVAINLRYAF